MKKVDVLLILFLLLSYSIVWYMGYNDGFDVGWEESRKKYLVRGYYMGYHDAEKQCNVSASNSISFFGR